MSLVRTFFIATLVLTGLLLAALLLGLATVDRSVPTALALGQRNSSSYVIRGARVLTMEHNTAHENWAVVVENGLISAVGPNESIVVEEGVRVINAEGKTLLPGLVDMHVHLYSESELAAFLSHGVTTVRNAGGMPFHLGLKKQLENSNLLGPRLLTSGPILNEKDGRNASILHTLVDGPDQARAAVRRQFKRGYGSVKVYSNLSLASYAAILEEAKALNMPVFGHPVEGKPPPDKPMARAPFDLLLDDGLVTLEHMESIVWHALDQDKNEDRARTLARELAAAGVVVDPTLLVHHNLTELTRTRGRHIDRPEMAMYNPLALLLGRGTFNFWANYKGDYEIRLAEFYQRCVKIFHEEGVILTVGTDSNAMVTPPGSSVSRELALFVRAGLTPFEALKSATVHPAKALNLGDKIGQIRRGYLAEMILVEGDPLVDVTVVKHPHGVMLGGIWLDEAELDELHKTAANPSTIRTLRHLIGLLWANW